MTSSTEAFQIPIEAAEAYEAKFVPALFRQWAPHLLEMADVMPGHTVLDVACGTGIVARTAVDRVGADGVVIGVDLNEAMLTVARRIRPDIEWRRGDAADLPFGDAEFDTVVCQMALMFFPDPVAALREMGRVAKDDGTVAFLVPSSLPAQPAWGPLVDVAARHAGPEAMSLLGTYFARGDLDELTALTASAGLEVVGTRTRMGTARFPSIDDLVVTEVESTPLIERIDDTVYRRIREDARDALAAFATENGELEAPIECHLIAATRRNG